MGKAFLTNRKQRVVIGDHYSCWEDVLSGVPQGSVLGPLLFIIFINVLPKLLKHLSKLFADDCKLIGIIKELGDVLEWISINCKNGPNRGKCHSITTNVR